MIILGIDTSCDDTSAAICDDLKILSSNVASQIDLHETFGGIVPEEASRAHYSNIDKIIKICLKEAKLELKDIDLVTVTNGPGLVGALLVGLNYGKSLAWSLDIPFYAANHLFSHVYSNFLGENHPELPAVSVVISGGHTIIGVVDENMNHKYLGSTLDDACGEVIDKVGRKLGLPYPAGPYLDKMALDGNKKAHRFPRPLKGREGYDFSFSGLKTSFLKEVEKGNLSDEDQYASLLMAISDCLCDRIVKLCGETGYSQVVFSGGVSASAFLRRELSLVMEKHGIKISFPELRYCTDNAAMVCASGYFEARNRNFEESKEDLNIDAYASYF